MSLLVFISEGVLFFIRNLMLGRKGLRWVEMNVSVVRLFNLNSFNNLNGEVVNFLILY